MYKSTYLELPKCSHYALPLASPYPDHGVSKPPPHRQAFHPPTLKAELPGPLGAAAAVAMLPPKSQGFLERQFTNNGGDLVVSKNN